MLIDLKNKDKRTGWIISLSIHAAIVVLFFFILAWQAPDPPLPEYGIELNFGMEQEGSGYEQPTVEPTPPTIEDEGEPEEQVEEAQEEIVEEQVESEPVEETAIEELPDSEQEDSPVETKPAELQEAPVEPVEKIVEEEVKPVAEPIIEEPMEEEPKVEEKVVDSNALYPGSSSQGNKENQAGDAGDPEGTVESRALYGKSGGGGGGPSLDLAGWRWDDEPKVNDSSKEKGKIVFNIKVDAKGYVIGVDVDQTTVSPGVVKVYKNAVQQLTFSQLSDNTIPAPISTGKITFIITSK
jgi:protein TonB